MELKNCPNCKERISINDTKCPYCNYIDDKRYKKENDKLKKRNIENKLNKKKLKKKLNPSKKMKQRNIFITYALSTLTLIILLIILIIKRIL